MAEAEAEDEAWKGHIRKVVHAFTPAMEDELQLSVGDMVELQKTPSGGWWKGNIVGGQRQSGWFPANHVEPHPSEEPSGQAGDVRTLSGISNPSGKFGFDDAASRLSRLSVSNRTPAQNGEDTTDQIQTPGSEEVICRVQATFAFERRNEDELELSPGTSIEVLKDPEGGWWFGRLAEDHTVEGWFPQNHTKALQSSEGAVQESIQADGIVPPRSQESEASSNATVTASSAPPEAGPAETWQEKRPPQRHMSVTSLMKARRANLNDEITKQLRIRDGAERLLEALSRDKKTTKHARDEVLLTLSFVNSRLQDLRAQLQELNAKVHAGVRRSVYRQASRQAIEQDALDRLGNVKALPFIALGMKETKPLKLTDFLGPFVQQHFGVVPEPVQSELDKLSRMRKSLEQHDRDDASRQQHFSYYHHMTHVQQRFFVDGVFPGLHFTWYDSFNGQPAIQRSIVLEKACVLFNAAALSTQLAASRNLADDKEIDLARDDLEIAAGTFQHILDHFSNPPSADLSPPSLQMLVSLCLAQAQECIVIGLIRSLRGNKRFVPPGEPATVAEMYKQAKMLMESEILKDYLPPTWLHLANIKAAMYEAIADFYTGVEQLKEVHGESRNRDAAIWNGVARLCRAETGLASAMKICRDYLPDDVGLLGALRHELQLVQNALSNHDRNIIYNRFSSAQQLSEMLGTKAAPSVICTPACPATEDSIEDPFGALGPVEVFNALNSFDGVRTILLDSRGKAELGVTLVGNCPVRVHSVVHKGPAANAGLQEDDVILAVNGTDMRHANHAQVVQALKSAGQQAELVVQRLVPYEDEEAGLAEEALGVEFKSQITEAASGDLYFTSFQNRLHAQNISGKSQQMSPSETLHDVFGQPMQHFANPMYLASNE